MSDLKPNAQKDKDVDSVSVSPGRTQEPLQSHTSSLKNNAAGLSLDEHENPLNGTQPNPFVYSSVPAVPHAGNSLPSGALVNGPGSHPTSEVHCVLNKGTVLSNNVLDAAWQAEKDTSPEVLPPPSELQSDAWKNTAGPVVKTPATQPGVNTPLPHSEENESKLAYSTLSGDGAEQMHISQPLTKQTMKTRSRRGAERSESSSDDYDDAEVIRWDSAGELFSHDDRRRETKVMHQRDRKHNTHVKSVSGSAEKVNNSLNHTRRRLCVCSSNDVENVDFANKDDSLGTQSDIKDSIVPLKDLSRNTASDSEHLIYSTAQEGCNEGNDPEDEDSFSLKVEQFKTEQVEHEPLFSSCTKCSVNYEEKRHFQRRMMYHLGKNNQVNCEDVSQPFICRECGRLFCDSSSLMRHIIIHQDRLEKLMEEIKGLRNTELEDRASTVHCPQRVLACNCPKILVRHAKAHDNLKHYYFCEECNYITLTQQALEAHLEFTHLNTCRPRRKKTAHANDELKPDCLQFQGSRRSEPGEKTAGSKPTKTIAALFADCSNKKRSFNIQKPNDRTITSSKFESLDSSKLSPSLWRVDRDGKLLLRSAEKLDTASDFTCMDAENNNCEAFGSAKQENCPANVDFSLSAKNLKLDQMLCPDNKNDCSSGSLQAKAKQNFLSTRKTLTPLHKTIDSVKSDLAPRLSQRQKKHSADWELVKGCEGSSNFLDGNTGTASFLENGENEKNLYAQRHFKKRQRFPVQDQPPRVLQGEDGGDEDCSDIEQLVIKEECTEESPRMSTSDGADVSPTQGVELKPCPYCPAMFDSGVGLSNHVRGHLHRVGLSYNARHMVSPELVAKQDHHPRIRRRTLCGAGKMKKAVKVETHGEHRCPLCRAWFETKTGLSNHVRGHLKRIGRSVTSTVKSPLSFLNELLQDQQEQQNILQVLNERRLSPRSQKFLCSKGLVLMHRRVPLKTKHEMKNPHLMLDNSQSKQENTDTEKKKSLAAMTSQSTLVELLMKRQERTGTNQETCAGRKGRKLCGPTEDYKEEPEMTRVGTTWLHDECDSKFVFRRCNHTSPLQRKRTSMFEGAGDDYKQRKLKSRPGLRKKIFSSVNAEVYTLTCRFCDLVFQGPLSIQEDWVKHLQRHLLHSSIPHSGTGMVEVLSRHHKISISMSGEHTECNPSAASD
ncbi:zinc finger protein 644 isoform X1 [Halichoeres trimaculatus]|uniref:zinc finger protein 644 isoform X1 n=1 Tax=Halichoeres trimaculatus TaxID=147232 RepID=UPI003D9E44FE